MVILYACISRRSWAVFCCSHQGKCGVMGRQWIKRRGSASVRRRDTSPRYQRTEHMAWIWICEGLWGGVHKLTPEPSTSPAGRSFDLIAEKYHLTQESVINVGQIAAVFIWAMLGGVHVSCCPGVPDRPEGSSENFVIELQICAAMRNLILSLLSLLHLSDWLCGWVTEGGNSERRALSVGFLVECLGRSGSKKINVHDISWEKVERRLICDASPSSAVARTTPCVCFESNCQVTECKC